MFTIFILPTAPMPATGFDQHRAQRFHGMHFTVQFHMPFAFKNQVNLRHLLMVVSLGNFLYFHEVDRRHRIVRLNKGSASRATGTPYRVHIC